MATPKRLLSSLAIAILLACLPDGIITALAESTNATASQGALQLHPVYLTGKEKAWEEFPKAPLLGSPVDLADLAITLSIQATRNEEQKAEANRDKTYSISLVSDVIDPSFASKYPATWAMLSQAGEEGYFINSLLKNENRRLRPYVQHPTLVMSLFTVSDYSYPSGHSSGAELQARLLGLLFPDKAEELRLRARQVADSRVVAGVHYTSDTEAGLNLGDLLFRELDTNAKFREDLAHAEETDKLPIIKKLQKRPST